MWQTDVTHYWLTNGRDVEILDFLDDHFRYLLACVAYPWVTGPAVVAVFRETIARHRIPASVLWRQRHGLHHPLRRQPRR